MHFFNIKGDDDDVDDNEETDDDYDQYDTSESDHENAIPTNIIKIKNKMKKEDNTRGFSFILINGIILKNSW